MSHLTVSLIGEGGGGGEGGVDEEVTYDYSLHFVIHLWHRLHCCTQSHDLGTAVNIFFFFFFRATAGKLEE